MRLDATHAKVIRAGQVRENSRWLGKVGKILSIEPGSERDWVTLDIDGEEVMFDEIELVPVYRAPGVP